MTRVAREIFNEGVAEGKVEGRVEGKVEGMLDKSRQVICDYLDARFGFDSMELQEKVKDLVNLDVLDKVLRHLFNADSLEKAQVIIEEAIKAQAKINHLQ